MTSTDLIYDGHRTRLKWHRARRTIGDPPFSLERIVEGLVCGASVEIDVRVGHDGVPVIRHDPLRWWRHGRTAGSGPPTPLAAVGETLTARGVKVLPASASLQLDIKDPARRITPDAAARVAAAVGPFVGSVIASGSDPVAVERIACREPRLSTGHDPCSRSAVRRLRRSGDVGRFVASALAAAPDARMIYLDHRIILALSRLPTGPVDIIAAFHNAGRTVDAYTLGGPDPETLAQVRVLAGLQVDQITTDDPDGLYRVFRDDAGR